MEASPFERPTTPIALADTGGDRERIDLLDDSDTSARLIDIQDNGIGDLVLACWIAVSADAHGLRVRINPRARTDVAKLFEIPSSCISDLTGPNWAQTPGLGHQYEYQVLARRANASSRFSVWCEALHLPPMTPVRPRYREVKEAGSWADMQWRKTGWQPGQPKLLIFPETAWSVRRWPLAYFVDVASASARLGFAVAVMATDAETVRPFNCWSWWGFPVSRVAAMIRRADLVLGNDSGPAHLAATIGVPTVVVAGPTRAELVFGQYDRVYPLKLSPDHLACVGCHFSRAQGYREACAFGGCQALMRLAPSTAVLQIERLRPELSVWPIADCDPSDPLLRSDMTRCYERWH